MNVGHGVKWTELSGIMEKFDLQAYTMGFGGVCSQLLDWRTPSLDHAMGSWRACWETG